jgi:FixJ family two-component response regulator
MPIPRRKRIVAVLDDDYSSLSAAESLLDALGFQAALFSSGEEFLASGVATEVDCLLLDIHLGPVSGIEIRRRLKLSHCALPVIFITALRDENVHEQALEAGCVACLRKPFPARQLLDAIEKATSG